MNPPNQRVTARLSASYTSRRSDGTSRRANARKVALLATMTTATKMMVVPIVTMARPPPSALVRMSPRWVRVLATRSSIICGMSSGRPIDVDHAWAEARAWVVPRSGRDRRTTR
jgi:hypothetical protein